MDSVGIIISNSPKKPKMSTVKTSEQPDKNALIFEQIKGCLKITIGLLEQLRPVTDNVKGCIFKLKEWQSDYLRILQKAFE